MTGSAHVSVAATLLLVACTLPFDPMHLPAESGVDAADSSVPDGSVVADGGCPEPDRVSGCAGLPDETLCRDGAEPGRCHMERCCTTCIDAAGCRSTASDVACGLAGAACEDCGTGTCAEGVCRPAIPFTFLSVGDQHTCTVGDDDGVRCWGRVSQDPIRNHLGSSTRSRATSSVGPISGFSAVRSYAGDFFQGSPVYAHSCALDALGQAFCWGGNDGGQLGASTPDPSGSVEPVAVEATVAFAEMSLGRRWSAAITTDRTGVWTWGATLGTHQLGRDGASRPAAVSLDGVRAPVRGIAARHAAGCLVDDLGTVWCWGTGPVGPGGSAAAPRRVLGLDGVEKVDVGETHACASTAEATIWCWGTTYSAAMGRRPETSVAQPAPLDIEGEWLTVATGGGHTCAVQREPLCPRSTAIYCWGANDIAQLGGGTEEPSSIDPVRVPTDRWDAEWVQLACGTDHCCALSDAGRVVCWGSNAYGELLRDLAPPYEGAPGEVIAQP
jgi:alpha-tubulin suppressor-like RCC1 family protein